MRVIKRRIIKLSQEDGTIRFRAYVVIQTGTFCFFKITKKLWLVESLGYGFYYLGKYRDTLFRVDQSNISSILSQATDEYIKQYKSANTVKKEVLLIYD